MKILGLILSFLTAPVRRRDTRLMLVLLTAFVALVAIYSTAFHELMEWEGRAYSWPTAIYWTLVTMTTLGFGDITFESDTGRLFSVVVLLSGTLFLLVLLPFTFIQFIWVPWMNKRESERAPRVLPATTSGHIILTGTGSIEDSLIDRATRAGIDYVVLVPELADALLLHDQGYRVMVGALDDPQTYRDARVEQAALVVASRTDTTNTNTVFTVREISTDIRIVSTANFEASVDILYLAGADQVLQLGDILGQALTTRILAGGARVIGEIAGLQVAEAALPQNSTLLPATVEAETGLEVLGTWRRGEFEVRNGGESGDDGVMILAGLPDQIGRYDEIFGTTLEVDRPVVVIGGGRVGRRVGATLADAGIDYKIVEKLPARVRDPERYVVGDAADLEILNAAGIQDAAAAVITTHDDDVNIYLTIYIRKLRPDAQVIARANVDRNVSTLYRAGADAVLSYASTGSAAIWNWFRPQDTLLVSEHLEVFKVPVPAAMAGRSIDQACVGDRTGCAVIAVEMDGEVRTHPDPSAPLPGEASLILLGDDLDQERFEQAFINHRRRP
jgi:voltage-gated potassium channel